MATDQKTLLVFFIHGSSSRLLQIAKQGAQKQMLMFKSKVDTKSKALQRIEPNMTFVEETWRASR